MRPSGRPWLAAALVAGTLLLAAGVLNGEPVAVRYRESPVHDVLALSTLDGTRIADGDVTETAQGDRITSRLAFRFKDGSVEEETTSFSQREQFRLIRDHLVQKGPSFAHPLDMVIDVPRGQVTVHDADDQGNPTVISKHLDLPLDLANGMIPVLLENIRADALPKTLSMVVATPAPRLVKLAISTAGEEAFSIGGTRRRAIQYVLKVEIGGLGGLFAPLLGKQPPDSHVWILSGGAPAFVKSEQPFFAGGPLWRIELVVAAGEPSATFVRRHYARRP